MINKMPSCRMARVLKMTVSSSKKPLRSDQNRSLARSFRFVSYLLFVH